MRRYLSESSLTVNAVGDVRHRLDWAERSVALGPTHLAEQGAPAGYPVGREDAVRVALQFKSPKYEHADRGHCFELTPAGTATISLRDPAGAAFLACPRIDGPGALPETLDACRFVAVHAIRTDTSRLFVPGPDADAEDVTAKIRDAADAGGFDRDPSNYYRVPDDAVLSWSGLAERLAGAARAPEAASAAASSPLSIRRGGEPTATYRAFLDRLGALAELYPRPDRRGAAPAPRESLDDAAADELLDHALTGYLSYYGADGTGPEIESGLDDGTGEGAADAAGPPTPQPAAERSALAGAIEGMRATLDPSLYRVRRTSEVVAERGERVADPLVLGSPLDGDGSGPADREQSRREEAPGTETTLSEFL